MLPLLLAFSAALSPNSATDHPSLGKVRPVSGSVQGLISSDDYPEDALKRNEQGTVGVVLTVGPDGLVRDCRVEQSSGYASLDAQTCRLVRNRAKLEPALDRRGKPTTGTLTARITWRIAGDTQPSEDWTIRSIISVASGRLPICHVQFEGALKDVKVPNTPCPESASELGKDLPKDSEVSVDMVQEQAFAVQSEPTTGLTFGDKLIGRQLAELEVDATGKLLSCKLIQTIGAMPPTFPGVCAIVAKRFRPRLGPNGMPAPFKAYFAFSAYGRFHHRGSTS